MPQSAPRGKDQDGRPASPRCEIRQLVVEVYAVAPLDFCEAVGHKAPGAGRVTVFLGRRGKPGQKLGTVSVIRGPQDPSSARSGVALTSGQAIVNTNEDCKLAATAGVLLR